MFLEINGIKKHYGEGESRVEVLNGIDIEVNKGEIVVLFGPSGSGKSTLLNIIGGQAPATAVVGKVLAAVYGILPSGGEAGWRQFELIIHFFIAHHGADIRGIVRAAFCVCSVSSPRFLHLGIRYGGSVYDNLPVFHQYLLGITRSCREANQHHT